MTPAINHYKMIRTFIPLVTAIIGFAFFVSGCNTNNARSNGTTGAEKGSKNNPLQVMLVPADGGTEEGTLADFEPIFYAITNQLDIHFDIRVGDSYSSVVEGMINEQVDIAFFGAVTYNQAKQAGAAELLAVAETEGKSVYYSGIFVRTDSGIEKLADLKGKKIAFGDVNSTSSFNYPMAMLIDGGIDPVSDLSKVFLTGSHTNSLQALDSGKTDAACAAFDSFAKAVQSGQIDPTQIKVIAKSDPIPYPPLAMHTNLDSETKTKLREAFNQIHTMEGVSQANIRGYGGKKVDRYNANYPPEEFDRVMGKLAKVTKSFKEAVLKKAAE